MGAHRVPPVALPGWIPAVQAALRRAFAGARSRQRRGRPEAALPALDSSLCAAIRPLTGPVSIHCLLVRLASLARRSLAGIEAGRVHSAIPLGCVFPPAAFYPD